MQKKQFPPVSLVKEDISEFYAITTDIFHVHHLYVTQKVNSKKKVVGFLSFKTQPNLTPIGLRGGFAPLNSSKPQTTNGLTTTGTVRGKKSSIQEYVPRDALTT